jgi:hypothetical protein
VKKALAATLCCLAAVLGFAVAGASAQAPGGLQVLSESAVFDPVAGSVTFTLVFNRVPDFQTEDSLGRRADAFQYYILGDPTLPYPAYYDAIVRGEELDPISGLLPIRDAVPPSSDPATGGWGPIRAVVPFQLSGRTLKFSASLDMISDHSLDGHFSYELLLTQYGATSQFLQNDSVIRPSSPSTRDQCKNGGWRDFGVFKNQGGCVSFVATKGKNPPAG